MHFFAQYIFSVSKWNYTTHISSSFMPFICLLTGTRYLANDMQFYLTSPIIIFALWKHRGIGLSLLATLLVDLLIMIKQQYRYVNLTITGIIYGNPYCPRIHQWLGFFLTGVFLADNLWEFNEFVTQIVAGGNPDYEAYLSFFYIVPWCRWTNTVVTYFPVKNSTV